MHEALAESLYNLGIEHQWHPYSGNHSNQMNVRVPLAFAFLDSVMNTGIEEGYGTRSVEQIDVGATIFRGPLVLPAGREYQVFDITGRRVDANLLAPGVYYVLDEGMLVSKVIKVR
jgi:hypothetical protein